MATTRHTSAVQAWASGDVRSQTCRRWGTAAGGKLAASCARTAWATGHSQNTCSLCTRDSAPCGATHWQRQGLANTTPPPPDTQARWQAHTHSRILVLLSGQPLHLHLLLLLTAAGAWPPPQRHQLEPRSVCQRLHAHLLSPALRQTARRVVAWPGGRVRDLLQQRRTPIRPRGSSSSSASWFATSPSSSAW